MKINTDRRALINYTCVSGDTFMPPPVTFSINETPEDFRDCVIKMDIKNKSGSTLKTLTNNAEGIAVVDNVLQYQISANEMQNIFSPGIYFYDVQKSFNDSVSTIQYGTIEVLNDTTI